MNYQSVMLYSVAYMLIIFVFFLNAIFIFGLRFGSLGSGLATALVVAASLVFGSVAFQNPNTFVFLSFSSLINMGVFVLQALSIA
jgi:hypothetical protein